LVLLVVAVLLHHHLFNLLDLDPIQVHSDRLALNAQVQLEQGTDVVEQLVVYRIRNSHASVRVKFQRPLQEVIHFRSDKPE
jgi:hypothetical protein